MHFSPRRAKGITGPAPCVPDDLFYYETMGLQFVKRKALQKMQLW
jgi:hypothetical protein